MFELFSSSIVNKDEKVKQQVYDYIQRNPCQFLFPVRDNSSPNKETYATLEECWKSILTLKKSKFMKGWKPSSDQYESLYDQLFDHYFGYYSHQVQQFVQHHPYLTWFVPKCFEQSQPLPSGRMGQVYLTQYQYKKLIVRELDLCMVTQNVNQVDELPLELLGITATRRRGQSNHRFALVYLAAECSLEQCIPQVDQWSFQKIFRTALSISSALRDSARVHPNLQPHNILLFHHQQQWSLVDNWSIVNNISPYYGRYPYLPPEGTLTRASNIYSLGVILWQLASGLVFPQCSPVLPDVYKMLPMTDTIHPAYKELVIRCLSKSPQQRPTASDVCDVLLNLLVSEMSCSLYDKQVHAQSIRDKQWIAARYLASCCSSSSADMQALLIGASISKRMMIQMVISFKRYKPIPSSVERSKETDDVCIQQKSYVYQDSYSCHYNHSNDLTDLIQMGSVA
ncbi:kinase-like domain-containing protein [Blakeslea trispora]|nr:kinase-like domain-containing protein [Blakeslea trispora]